MPNPERVILNLIQNLFRAGLFRHLTESNNNETLKSQTLNLFQGMVQGDKIVITTQSRSPGKSPGGSIIL